NSSESASTNSNPGSPAVPSSSATSPATDLSSSLSRLKPTSGTISTPAIATRIAKPGQAVTSGGALISQRVTDALNKVRSALTPARLSPVPGVKPAPAVPEETNPDSIRVQ